MVEYKSISRIGSRTINEDCVGMHQKGEEYGFLWQTVWEVMEKAIWLRRKQ